MKNNYIIAMNKSSVALGFAFLLFVPFFAFAASDTDSGGISNADKQALIEQSQQIKTEITQEASQINQIKSEVSQALSEAENKYYSSDSATSGKYKKAIDYGKKLDDDCDYLSQRVTVLVAQYNLQGNSDIKELTNAIKDLTTILTKLDARLSEMNGKIDKLNNYLDKLVDDDGNGGKDDTLIQNRYPNKIVYKNSASDSAARSDCSAREGTYNSCGTSCAPNAQNCPTVCVKTCTGFEDDDGGEDSDVVSEAKNKLASLRTEITKIDGKITTVENGISKAEEKIASASGEAKRKYQRAIDYGDQLVSDFENLRTRAETVADTFDDRIEQYRSDPARLRGVIADIDRTKSSLLSKYALLDGKTTKMIAYIDAIVAGGAKYQQEYDQLVSQAKTRSDELWRQIDEIGFRSGDIEEAIKTARNHYNPGDNSDYSRKLDRAIKYGTELEQERDRLHSRAVELVNARNVDYHNDWDLKQLTQATTELTTLLTKLDTRIATLNQKIDKLNKFLDLVINHQPPPSPSSSPPFPTPTRTPAPSASPTTSPSTAFVSILSSGFQPANITVKTGTRITWTNNDSTVHSLTSDIGGLSSGNIPSGGSFSIKFVTVGSYSYYDTKKPEMKGTVTVTQ